ncbi:MAG: hypothetical protein H7178_06935 [Chitinophagaceae bacterium]|nr:hypothetical protein [Chitinophagaceae bacterium]
MNGIEFFRDKEAFDILRTEVLPNIFTNKKKDDTVKVWSMA